MNKWGHSYSFHMYLSCFFLSIYLSIYLFIYVLVCPSISCLCVFISVCFSLMLCQQYCMAAPYGLTKYMWKSYMGTTQECYKNKHAVLNKSGTQYPTKQQLWGHLPSILQTILIGWTRHARHCLRSKDMLTLAHQQKLTSAPCGHRMQSRKLNKNDGG